MANTDPFAKLVEGVRSWNRWRDERYGYLPAMWRGAMERGRKYPQDIDLMGAALGEMSLVGVNFAAVALDRAILRDADLTRANLQGASLNAADLQGAKLHEANCRDIRASKTDFRKAHLVGANLSGANLTSADFRGADLRSATFHSAELADAQFADAVMCGTVFGKNDLSAAEGLDRVRHWGPSTIDFETLTRSRGIADEFLRGVGITDVFMTYAKSILTTPIDFYSCFISYSHSDKLFARALHNALQSRGIRCWLDEKQLLPGHDIYDEVDRGIRLWDKVLLCCSQHSLNSWWVDNEIANALAKEQWLMKERGRKVLAVVPLNLDGYLFSNAWTSGYREQIRRRFAADFTEWQVEERFQGGIQNVVRALRTDDDATEKAPQMRL